MVSRALLLSIISLLLLSGCVALARRPLVWSNWQIPFSAALDGSGSSPKKNVSAENKTSEDTGLGIGIGSYVPASAKETYYTAGPMVSGTFRAREGMLKNFEFALALSYSGSKEENLETLQGHSTGKSMLFLPQSNYVIPLGRISDPADLRLLAGAGCGVEAGAVTTKYFDPATGCWITEKDSANSATLLLDASLSWLWHLNKDNAIDFRLGALTYPFSDNVTSAVFFSIGYRF